VTSSSTSWKRNHEFLFMSTDDTPPQYTVVDLFAGMHGWSTPFEQSPRWGVVTVDRTSEFDTGAGEETTISEQDIVADIGNLSAAYLPDDVDLLVASVPCTTFTLAALGVHRHDTDNYPKTEKAAKHETLVKHTLELVEKLNPTYYVIENPRAKLRKMDFMPSVTAEVTWCQYEGASVMKPTDLFGELPQEFDARNCSNGDDCHDAAPRGSDTGTQGKGSSAERAKIPTGLATELMTATTAALDRARGLTGSDAVPFFNECGTCGNPHKTGDRFCPTAETTTGPVRVDASRFRCSDGHVFFSTVSKEPHRSCPYCEAVASDAGFSYPVWKDNPANLAGPVGDVVTVTEAGRSFAVPENFELLPSWTEERDGYDVETDTPTMETVEHYAAYHPASETMFCILEVVIDEWHPEEGHHQQTGWWTQHATIEPAREPKEDLDTQNVHGGGLDRFV
jgi:hypothetical protein